MKATVLRVLLTVLWWNIAKLQKPTIRAGGGKKRDPGNEVVFAFHLWSMRGEM